MKLATQEEVNQFYAENMNDESIYPYLTTSQYTTVPKVDVDDWGGRLFITLNRSCLLHISISRSKGNELSFSVFSKNSFAAGKSIKIIEEYAKRYDAKSIESIVHSTNHKSLKITERMLGKAWGVEPLGAWNSKLGKWEDLVHFKRILR